jgi:hypothetical protein
MANLNANTSIVTGLPVPQPEKPNIYAPDVNGPIPADVPTLMMSYPVAIPPNFDELSKEEQELLMAQYRFNGIPCRPDLPGTIPITRETLDIP